MQFARNWVPEEKEAVDNAIIFLYLKLFLFTYLVKMAVKKIRPQVIFSDKNTQGLDFGQAKESEVSGSHYR